MPKVSFNGYLFSGIFKPDINESQLPTDAGVCLVCTESGYGIKVMSIEDCDNIRGHIAKSKRRDCWKRIAEKGVVDIYYLVMNGKEDRAKCAVTVRNGRKYKLMCEEDL
jgi:hypothetical protein